MPVTSSPTSTEGRSGEPKPLDYLGAHFDPAGIYDRSGIHLALAMRREGDELICRAHVQNTWTGPRQVRLVVTPERRSGRGKLPVAEHEVEIRGGEVGTIEVVVPIPDEARGTFRVYYSFVVKGAGGGRWLHQRRRMFSERLSGIASLAIGLLGTLIWGGGVFHEVQIEAADRTRMAGVLRGSYTRIRLADDSLEAVSPPRRRLSTKERWLVGALVSVMFVVLVFLVWEGIHPKVFVVNGLSYPVQITIGSVQATIPRRSVQKLRLGLGTWEARAVADSGLEVDATTITAKPPRSVIVWNVDGRAPVYIEEVTYGWASSATPPRFYCGRNLIEFGWGAVQDAFEAPPDQQENSGTRTHLDVLDMNNPEYRCP